MGRRVLLKGCTAIVGYGALLKLETTRALEALPSRGGGSSRRPKRTRGEREERVVGF